MNDTPLRIREAAARAIGDWVPVLSRQTARLAARAALIAARKARA